MIDGYEFTEKAVLKHEDNFVIKENITKAQVQNYITNTVLEIVDDPALQFIISP